MSVRYRVTAKYLTCHSAEAAAMLGAMGRHQTLAIGGHNQGAILPESVPADEVERFLAASMIEPVQDEEE